MDISKSASHAYSAWNVDRSHDNRRTGSSSNGTVKRDASREKQKQTDIGSIVDLTLDDFKDYYEKETVGTRDDEKSKAAVEEQIETEGERTRQRVRESATTGVDEAEASSSSSGKMDDKSGELTRRLVQATHQLQISDIVGEANKELINLRIALASAKGKQAVEIKRIIKKMEKVVTRCFKKNRELGQEDAMRLEARRAEVLKEKERAKEIKDELRKKIKDRQKRERKYLDEDDDGSNRVSTSNSNDKLDAASEAQISIQAQAIASAEVSSGMSSGDFGGSADFGGGTGTGAEGSASTEISGSGDSASGGGGEIDVSV